MKKPTQKTIRKKLIKQLDTEWAKAIKTIAGHKCEICGSTDRLASHHFHTKKAHGSVRWYLSNGVCLCIKCHFKIHNSSHNTEMVASVIEVRGQEWETDLRVKAKKIVKFSISELEIILNTLRIANNESGEINE